MISFWKSLGGVGLALAACSQAFACSSPHMVIEGDTLWDISTQQMGTPWSYPLVFDANRDQISDPDKIYIGDALNIPCKTGALGEIDWSVMPRPDAFELIKARLDVQIVDIRPEKALANGTVPGAVSIPYSEWRGPKENPGKPRSAAYYSALIGDAGLRLDVPILLVHAKGNPMSTGSSAHVYWILKSLGAEQMAILRGGFADWDAANPGGAAAPSVLTPYTANLNFSGKWHVEDQEVLEIAFDKRPGVLLDARPHRFYQSVNSAGEAIASTIPGARSLPASRLMTTLAGEFDIEDGVETVIDTYRNTGALRQGGDIITFCHSGELAALNWFYASELASIENVKLYPESLVGWNNAVGVLGVGEDESQS